MLSRTPSFRHGARLTDRPIAGRTRFDRLYHIGRTSTVLCTDALKAAITEAKSGKDVGLYRIVVETLREVAPNEPEAVPDKAWIEVTDRSNKNETQRLEMELRGYKNNLVKESVRVSGRRASSVLDPEAGTGSDSWDFLDWQRRPRTPL
ncbi:hypothetical protein IMZ48_24460 [Candidatus Bathyarchaeota archaeon]|nr:hypothetical protein [Candidatus Bathyarchaeota archaeon]